VMAAQRRDTNHREAERRDANNAAGERRP